MFSHCVAPLVPFTVLWLGVFSTNSQGQDNRLTAPSWGDPSNGLRCRVATVHASMSEDEIDLSQIVIDFQRPEHVAFAVELENISDQPIKLLGARSTGKAKSDWFEQFLFWIELYDANGNKIERPEVQVVDLNLVLERALPTTIQPKRTHRFLLRPMNWLSVMTQRLERGKLQAAVHYRGLPARTADRIREYQPDSTALGAWSGDIVSPPAAFEIATPPNDRSTTLAWGDVSGGLRAALELVPRRANYRPGDKPEFKLHVQNVSETPATLATHLWLSDMRTTVKNAQDREVPVRATWYSGWTLSGRIRLQPQQVTILDAGNLGIASDNEQADAFEHVTHRKLIAPAGTYRVQLTGEFGSRHLLRDGKGKQLVPLKSDWIGQLTTDFASFVIAAE